MGGIDTLMLGALVLAAFAAYNLMSTLFKTNSEQDALRWATGDEPVRSKSPIINFSRPLVHNFTLQHAVRIKHEGYRQKISMRIKTAGLEGELNVDEYIGLQILWGLLFPVILFVLNFALNLGWPAPVMIGFGLCGFAFPNLYASGEKKRRYTSVVADLPFFLDLLTLSVAAGLDLMGAMQRIVDKAEKSVLAEEFGTVLKDIRLGRSRDDALKEMANRLDTGEITSFVAVVVDAYASGTSIGKVLKDQSEQLRMERFVRAEKAGARASQMILIPLMMFILPAVMVVVFGPVVIQFVYGGTGQ